MQYFIVDAFTDKLFKGNPAGVCILDEWIDESIMQNIAFENNLAETAFIVKRKDYYDLRWFTPELEMDLCGHATLASAFIVDNFVEKYSAPLRFETISGALIVEKINDLYVMDFPARKPLPIEVNTLMEKAVNASVLEAHLSRDLLLVVEDEDTVRTLTPDIELLKTIPDVLGVIATAKGSTCDFVSRFFAPNVDANAPEDPVTGSAHCTLIPFWSERLHKNKMLARQLSKREGTLFCEDHGDRVKIAGKAVLYLQGEIIV